MIISIGEVVWDIFPESKVLGGAPINVAYHLATLKMDVGIITRIGEDELGDRTLGTLAALGLPLEGVQRGELPTGTVNITFDDAGNHHFDIVAPAAWDDIDLHGAETYIGERPFHMVFGTLAQRDQRSRKVIRSLWQKADKKFYDVNLRPPFTTADIVEESLAAADLVKMNDEELLELGRWYDLFDEDGKIVARNLMDRYNIRVMVVTAGSSGAWLRSGDEVFADPGRPVKVADTVGAGDAFFASLIEGYLAGRPWPVCLTQANERGGYVASKNGATPPMP